MRNSVTARRLAPAIAAVVVLGLVAAPIASADATFDVNTTIDTNAVNPAVSAVDSGGNLSLRCNSHSGRLHRLT